MGAATVAVLNTKINADPGGLLRGFSQAQGRATDFGKKIKDVQANLAAAPATNIFDGAIASATRFSSVLSRITPALGAIGIGLSFAGVANGIDALDGIAKTADGLGTTAGKLQELRYAADLAGNGAESLDTGISKLVRNLGEINAGGATEVAATFQRLRLDPRQLGAMDASDAFKQVAMAIGQLPTAADKASAATRIFGREAMQLAPLFEQSETAFAAMASEARGFGVGLSAIDVAKVDQAGDSFDRLKAAISGAGQNLLVELSPAIIAANEFLTNTVSIVKNLDTSWIRAAVQTATFATTLGSTIKVASLAVSAYQRLADATAKVSKAQATAAAIAQALSGPKGWLTLAVGALAATGATYLVGRAFDQAATKLSATTSETAAAAAESAKLKKEMAMLADTADSGTGAALKNAKTLGDVFRDLVRKGEEASAATFAKLMERGNALTLEVRAPEMKFVDDVRELQQLRDMGAITGDVFDKAFGNANNELRDALRNLSDTKNAISDVGAATKGTSAGFAALYGGVGEANRRMQEAKKIEEQIAAAKLKLDENPFKPVITTEWRIDPKLLNPDEVRKPDALQGNLRGGFQGRESNFPSIINDATKGVKFPPLEAKPFPMIEAKPLPLLEAKPMPPVQVDPPKGWFDMFKADYWRKPVSQEDMSLRMAEQRNGESDSKALEQLNKTNQELLTQNKRQTAELEKLRATKTITVKQVKL